MSKLVKIIKKIKIKNIIILIFLLVANTYAWFTYMTKVNMDLSVHVTSWNVDFVADENETVTNMHIEVEKAYPGMEPFEKTLEVLNTGEMVAELSYEIQSLRVMNTTYTMGETLSSADIEKKITEEYPFKITITKEDISSENTKLIGRYKIEINWEFESGNDEEDTKWGNNAYEFYNKNPDKSFMELNINFIASQKK